MLKTVRDRISSDRIAVGIIRLAVVLLVGTVAIICWRQAGPPYAEMQSQIAKVPEFYATYLSSGTPVYYGSEKEPQQLQVQVGSPPFIDVAEPNLIDEAVQCVRNSKNPLVHVVQHMPDTIESPSVSPFRFPQTIVLFDKKSTADKVFAVYAPLVVTPDFRDIDPNGRLDSCVVAAYMKYRNEMSGNISASKREFYTSSALLLAKILLAEIALCILSYWVLRGFFKQQRIPPDERR